jgi:hypothetical protein
MPVLTETLETRRSFCVLAVSGIAFLLGAGQGTAGSFEASMRCNAGGTLTIHRAGGVSISAASLRTAAKASRTMFHRTRSRAAARAVWQAALLSGR